MPTPTYVSLATYTLSSTDSEIIFSSIPATYRDLILVIEGTKTNNADVRLRFNSDTGNNYSYVFMSGQGGSAQSSAASSQNSIILGFAPASQRQLSITSIMDYSAIDKHKTILSRNNDQSHNVSAWAGRWANTNAVNNVNITLTAGSWNIGSTFSLFGIAA
jgi:hypothetical protein